VPKQHSLSGADAERQPSPSVRVLIVDDYEPWRRWVYSQLLTQQQLQVVDEASDGLEAVRKAQELKPDIILLDIGLKSLNGLDAAKRIAQSASGSKIVFLTAQTDSDLVKQALKNGAAGYVLKVDAKTELLEAITAVIQGRRFVSRRLAIEF
jgi:DNA-binding NarL/FixJ family response regulator